MIQWYPGHMAKAKNILKKDLKVVDLVVEVLDARLPLSSRNPDLNQLLGNKYRIIALNKIDLADNNITLQWKKHFEKECSTIRTNSVNGKGVKKLLSLIKKQAVDINKKVKAKGRKSRDIRIMVIGIPNVGKSALINSLAGSNIARIGNKPGVTRGRQWVNITDNIQLLDTPGILWPKLDDEEVGYKLALTGAIKYKLYDEEIAAYKLIEYIIEINKMILENAYDFKINTTQSYDILVSIGKKTGCLMSGGKIDRNRTATKIVTDYRQGKLGVISLEKPEVDS